MIPDVCKAFGLFLALLAILGRVTPLADVPGEAMRFADVTVLCHHDDDADAPARQPPSHPSQECLLCFVCHNPPNAIGLVAPAPLWSMPEVTGLVHLEILPPATAPPRRIALATSPRGPPIRV
jgi:hypothetical protein